MNIPINIETLLSGKVVESERIEYKKSWNPVSVMRTVSAFANDFENLGSGYIVIGVEEENGIPKRPVYGFSPDRFDKIQKEMIGYCNLIRPPYFPRLSLEEIDNKHVLLIWVTAGSNRPYEVPRDVTARVKDYSYYIRKYSSTIQANNEQKQELISLTANIPFDDRVNSRASVNDIIPYLINTFAIIMFRQYYKTIPGDLIDAARIDGCSEFAILFRIFWPLSVPTLITVGILTFMNTWNEVLWPMIVIRKWELMTMPQLVAMFATGGAAEGQLGTRLAAATLLALPIVTAYLFFQRYFIESMANTGLKG